jgi:hypothetical protein
MWVIGPHHTCVVTDRPALRTTNQSNVYYDPIMNSQADSEIMMKCDNYADSFILNFLRFFHPYFSEAIEKCSPNCNTSPVFVVGKEIAAPGLLNENKSVL